MVACTLQVSMYGIRDQGQSAGPVSRPQLCTEQSLFDCFKICLCSMWWVGVKACACHGRKHGESGQVRGQLPSSSTWLHGKCSELASHLGGSQTV